MDYDIIICAVIAVLVLARLWSVLGQRGSEPRERPNPFAQPFAGDPRAAGKQGDAPALPKPALFAPDSLAGGLAQIKEADPAFDEKQFLQNARSAFTLILGNYAKGDLAPSERFLSPAVLAHFQRAIEARRNAGQSMEHNLVAIRDAECVTAKLDNGSAIISVRFVSDQETTLRDASGEIVGEHDGKTEEVIDLWTFTRDTKTPNADWILTETRS